eukprot:9983636-Prorocentrum_lima.AAC.1
MATGVCVGMGMGVVWVVVVVAVMVVVFKAALTRVLTQASQNAHSREQELSQEAGSLHWGSRKAANSQSGFSQ